MAEHRIGREVRTHRRWDVGLEPVLRVQPGDIVTAETDDFAGGQITRDSAASELLALDLDAIYPLAGPVAIEGAEPGDAISIEILGFELPDWGWSCLIPGLGILPVGEFAEPAIRHFDLTGGVTAELCPGVEIPIEPFCGTMGVPGSGMRGVPIPVPHAGGGNIDNRHLTRGATLYLPVATPGGLFSVGDAHAAQGDGEVGIAGLECSMATTYRVGLLKGVGIPAPQIRKPAGSLTPRVDRAGWYATSGIEPDLMTAAQVAVRAMIEHLGRERGLGREDAYILCSLAGDLKITEVVDAPNWMVSFFMPDAVFIS